MTRKVCERPRLSTPKARQENGVWKIRRPRSAAKNRASGRPAPRAARKRNSATPMSLRLVHHAELERRALQLRELALQATDQARFGQEPVLVESGGHLGEDRPEELPLPIGQASPSDRAAARPRYCSQLASCQASTTRLRSVRRKRKLNRSVDRVGRLQPGRQPQRNHPVP